MKYFPIVLVAVAVALAAAAALPLASPGNDTRGEGAAINYVPSKHLYIDYVDDIGNFLQRSEGFDKLVRRHYGGAYWVKGVAITVALASNSSLCTRVTDVPSDTEFNKLLFIFMVEDVIKGPENLLGKEILIHDPVTSYEDGKFLFIYDHLPLIPGKTYVLAITPRDVPTPFKYEVDDVCDDILSNALYTADPIMRFLVTSDGHVIYLYDRDTLYATDPDYATVMNKVVDPVVLTYIGNDLHLTGRATYKEFQSWLLNELGQ